MNSQPSTSYSTPIQYIGLSATILTLETTWDLTETGNTEHWRRPTLETVLDGPLWLTAAWQHIFAENRRPTAISGQTGSENAAETAHVNSQPSTSYSTPNTLCGIFHCENGEQEPPKTPRSVGLRWPHLIQQCLGPPHAPPPNRSSDGWDTVTHVRRKFPIGYNYDSKGPNVTNPICWTCKSCSYKCVADCEHCVIQSSTELFW